MKKTNNKPLLSVILSLVLIVVMALTMFGCTSNKTETPADTTLAAAQTQEFSFSVTHKDGSVKDFTLTSDKKTVGEALLELKMIEGEDGPYGLYVKTVDGETLDYDTDGMYWAFYIGTEMAPTSVDMTDIVNGETYRLVAAK